MKDCTCIEKNILPDASINCPFRKRESSRNFSSQLTMHTRKLLSSDDTSQTSDADVRVSGNVARIGHILQLSLNPRNEKLQLNPSVIRRAYSTPVDPSSRRHTTTSSELDSSGATNHPVHKYTHLCKQVLTYSLQLWNYSKSSIHNLPGARLLQSSSLLSSRNKRGGASAHSLTDEAVL